MTTKKGDPVRLSVIPMVLPLCEIFGEDDMEGSLYHVADEMLILEQRGKIAKDITASRLEKLNPLSLGTGKQGAAIIENGGLPAKVVWVELGTEESLRRIARSRCPWCL